MSNQAVSQSITLDARPAGQLRFEGPSCGSQPAHFRLTRVDTTRSPQTADLIWPKEAAAATTVAAAASPCPLTKRPTYQGFNTIFTAPSFFFWKISYAYGASARGKVWVANVSTPSGSASVSNGMMSSTHFLTLA